MDDYTKPYKFWGIKFREQIGDELIATCPFCEHDDSKTGKGHFYLNAEKGLFICHFCEVAGNHKDFLFQIYLKSLADITDEQLETFCKFTNVPWSVSKPIIGYYNNNWTFPLYTPSEEKNKLEDIRSYNQRITEFSTAGCHPIISNYHALIDPIRSYEDVWIVEGFRKQLFLEWLLERNNVKGIVCSIPGANTFKNTYINYFSGRNRVIICLDNDEAGRGTYNPISNRATGGYKIYYFLKNVVKQIWHIDWPKELPQKFDIKDFLIPKIQQPVSAFIELRKLLKLYPEIKIQENLPRTLSIVQAQAISSNGHRKIDTSVDTQVILKEAAEVYKLDQELIDGVRISLATALSINIPGKDNLWMMLVGPPSSGKSICCDLFKLSNKCIWESNLRKKALVSGYGLSQNLVDPSILNRINNKCLVMKDLTQLLQMSPNEIKEVFGVLINSYDGYHKEPFGTGFRQYICNYSFLAGVTHAIKAYSFGQVGERFLRYEFTINRNEDELLEKSMRAQFILQEGQTRLQNAVSNYLDIYRNYAPAELELKITDDIRNKIKALAKIIAFVRTQVLRFEYGLRAGQLVYEPVRELSLRAANQLQKLGLALTFIDKTEQINLQHYKLMKRIALDTISGINLKILRNITLLEEAVDLDTIRQLINLQQAKFHVDDMMQIGIIEHDSNKQYRVTDEFRNLWITAEL